MTDFIYPTYRHDNAASKYPFVDAATLVGDDGTVIASDLLIDAVLHPPDVADSLFLSGITISATGATFHISGESAGEVCSGTIGFEEDDGTIVLFDAAGRPSGILLSSPDLLTGIRGIDLGLHTFQVDATRFVISVVRPCIRKGVTALQDEAGGAAQQDVWLLGENGIILSAPEAGLIRVDVVGDPLWRRRVCGDVETFRSPRFLKTFRGISPDAYGRMFLVAGRQVTAGTALRIRPSNGELVIGLAKG